MKNIFLFLIISFYLNHCSETDKIFTLKLTCKYQFKIFMSNNLKKYLLLYILYKYYYIMYKKLLYKFKENILNYKIL